MATEGAAYSYNIATTDNDGDLLTISASTLPIWITLTDNDDGNVSITGTPANSEVGSHSVVLEVTDGNATAKQSFSIEVSGTNDAPTFIEILVQTNRETSSLNPNNNSYTTIRSGQGQYLQLHSDNSDVVIVLMPCLQKTNPVSKPSGILTRNHRHRC